MAPEFIKEFSERKEYKILFINMNNMSYYKCLRCNYKTYRYNDMKKHLNRKIKCTQDIDSYKYDDNFINEKSLLLKYNENGDIEKKTTGDDNKIKCNNCNMNFTKKSNLVRHLKKCVIEVPDQQQLPSNHIENHIESQYNIANQHNISTTNNVIIVNSNNLCSFNEKWTIEHIDEYLRNNIFLSGTKYTDLLDEILKDKNNLNVIIEKDSNYGLVYKNEDELYVNMKVKEIIEKSMDKLYEQLNDLYSSIGSDNKMKINTNIIENEKKIMDNKYDNFCNNNNNTKSVVENLLASIYEKRKDEAVVIADDILQTKKIGY
jgi:hypothetical protein